ncbi:retrovirus-related pol polyprotein from transposon TNT 1-94 [Tanacetum coccineum]
MVPKAVLMRSGLVSLTTARPVNTAQPKTTVNNDKEHVLSYLNLKEIDWRICLPWSVVTPKEGKSQAEAEAVNTACYVQNKVLVTKPHNKTPYELFLGRKPALGFMRPFGCPVTILNTIDHLGKFDGKADEGFFVGYSINRSGPNWLFDIDALTKSMNYKPVVAGN